MRISRIAATICLLLILAYGIFRIPVLNLYTDFLGLFFDINDLNDLLNEISNKKVYRAEIAGWILYYPTYLLLHVIFIQILFFSNKNVRNTLSIGLVGLVSALVVLVLIGKYFELNLLYRISYKSFKNLFGLPFILLAIEGGRILYNDVIELQKRNSRNT